MQNEIQTPNNFGVNLLDVLQLQEKKVSRIEIIVEENEMVAVNVNLYLTRIEADAIIEELEKYTLVLKEKEPIELIYKK